MLNTMPLRCNSAICSALLLVVLSGCGDNRTTTGATCVWNEDTRPKVLHELGCPADHSALSANPESSALPASRSVLFLVDRRDNGRVHFFDSERWRHFTYADEELGEFPDMSSFNAEMYYQEGRRLLLGTLTYHVGPDVWAVSIAPIDKASPAMIGELFQAVAASMKFDMSLRYHPSSNALEMPSRLPDGVSIVTTEELYEGATYQGMHLGETIGRVRRLKLEELSTTYVSRMDIVVLDRVPNDIAAVAGLITGEFQTPLAHVNLLAEARNTPNMALRNAWEDPELIEKEGKWVKLTVRADGYDLTPSTADEADVFWAGKRPAEPQQPPLDLSLDTLIDLGEVDASMTAAVGGKAANFGELLNIVPPIPVPDGFAVPCSFYANFISDNGLNADIETLLASSQFKEDGQFRMEALAMLRAGFRTAPVNLEVLTAIQEKIDEKIGAGISVRLRSSANAEDLAAFNGAGLYDSYTYKPNDPEKTLADALRSVWASLWNIAAFEEREWARVDHLSCAMGVLVHRSFPDDTEAANGVAITDNPFDPPPTGQAAYYINVQQGAVSVTNPAPGITPESFLYYKPPAGQGELTRYSTSSLTNGQDVLSFDEIQSLVAALKAVHTHFQPIYGDVSPYAMDVEFKFIEPDRTLVVKQARPYSF